MDIYPIVLRRAILFLALGLLTSGAVAFAGSATWSATPGNGNWNVATNWSPTTIPNSAADGANFNASSMHSISLSASTQVNGIYFGLAASTYTITTSPGLTFTISGLGISNNSPAMQGFVMSVSGAFIGQTEFKNSASAGTLTSFTNNGSMFSSSFYGGGTHFFNTSTADHTRLINNGGGVNGALGGMTGFYDGATAASSIINNNGGAVSGAGGGETSFFGTSSADNAQIINRRAAVSGASSGSTQFYDHSTAYGAVFTNMDAGSTGDAGGVGFRDNSSAGGGVFDNQGGTFNGALGGSANFADNSTATGGTFYNRGGTVSGGGGGHVQFNDTATAYYGTFANYGGTTAAASGGATVFLTNSTAGNGEFGNYAATGAGGEGGSTNFYYSSTADNGTFTNYPAPFNTTGPGTTSFNDIATAGNGIFVNNGGSSGASGRTLFAGNSSAGNGNFTNNSAAGSTQTGGHTDFSSSATAGTATFDNKAGAASGVAGGFMSFSNTATAGNATIYNRGAAVTSGGGGSTYFAGSSTAGGSTLYAEAGSGGGLGGSIVFQDTSDGGTARAVLSGAGSSAGGLDLTELNSAGMGIGSIEGGGGIVWLGSKTLTVGSNNLDTTYSGVIRNSGNLTKVGTGALTLSGANTYTGLTTVNSGTLIVNGSIAGNADVKSGATLKGTGSIAGTLTCETGSICAPGTSPGTLTVGGLDLLSGSTLEFELGATRDHIVVTSQGDISLGGVLNISLIDGFIPTEPIVIFEGSIETMTGNFSAVHAPVFNGHTLRPIYGAGQMTLQVADAGNVEQAASFSTPIPGGTGNFSSLPAAPAYSSTGQLAFYGVGANAQQGIYRTVNQGTHVKVADLNTEIPGGTGNFTSFIPQEPVLPQEPTRPSISGSSVAFFGAGSGGQQGIYVSIPQDPIIPVEPTRIADTSTAIPGGTGNFTSFIPQEPFAPSPSISGNRVAFFGAGSGGQQGIYRTIPQDPTVPGNPVKVVDLNTAIPGGSGNFTAIPQEPMISGDNVVFLGKGAGGQQGVYVSLPQDPTIPVDPIKIADLNTAIPGGSGNFTSFIPVEPVIPQEPIAPTIDGTRVAFFGAGSGAQRGIYVSIPQDPFLPQEPFKIVDTSTAIPDGSGNFTGFGAVSVSDIDVAFLGLGANGQQGIYDMTGGSLRRVVDLNDVLAGVPITGLTFSRSGLVGDQLAFQATFTDGSQGMYIWSLPALDGDFNANGVVDAADYVGWRKNNGSPTDYLTWRKNFGQPFGSSASTSAFAAIPEPASAFQFILAIMSSFTFRRRKCH